MLRSITAHSSWNPNSGINGVNNTQAKCTLTDIVVLSARAKLKAQGEWSEELELLRELQGSVRWDRPVTLPALEAFRRVVTGAVSIIVHHVEDVALGAVIGHRRTVMRTVDVEVVVDADVNVVITSVKPGVQEKIHEYETHSKIWMLASRRKYKKNRRPRSQNIT